MHEHTWPVFPIGRNVLARFGNNDITTFFNTRLQVVPDRFVAKLGAMQPKSLMEINGFEAKPVKVNLFQDDKPIEEVPEADDDGGS